MTSALTRLTENMASASWSRGRLVSFSFELARAIRRGTNESSVCLMDFYLLYRRCLYNLLEENVHLCRIFVFVIPVPVLAFFQRVVVVYSIVYIRINALTLCACFSNNVVRMQVEREREKKNKKHVQTI
ncbi:hypothetical protein B0H11DRAFT_643777 [Mycena galericulata]|nr:hypothetical protein B0H11DRAFT_643777 [Mycena galericulata]